MPKHRLIWWRNVGSLTFFVCIGLVMAPKSCYLKSVNHKIVTWNTNRPRRLYFTIFFNLLFPYFPIFSLNCVCCHLFSADNFSVFMYNFIHFDSMKFILNHIYSQKFPLKIRKLSKELLNFKTKTIILPLPNTVYIHNDSFPIKSAFLPPFRIGNPTYRSYVLTTCISNWLIWK
jgi:hypothetical protein